MIRDANVLPAIAFSSTVHEHAAQSMHVHRSMLYALMVSVVPMHASRVDVRRSIKCVCMANVDRHPTVSHASAYVRHPIDVSMAIVNVTVQILISSSFYTYIDCMRKVCQLGEVCDGGGCVRVVGRLCTLALRDCGEAFECMNGVCVDRIIDMINATMNNRQ